MTIKTERRNNRASGKLQQREKRNKEKGVGQDQKQIPIPINKDVDKICVDVKVIKIAWTGAGGNEGVSPKPADAGNIRSKEGERSVEWR